MHRFCHWLRFAAPAVAVVFALVWTSCERNEPQARQAEPGAPAGQVVEVTGKVTASRAAESAPRSLTKGATVWADDTIETSEGASVMIVLYHNQARWELNARKQQRVDESKAWAAARGRTDDPLLTNTSEDHSAAAGRQSERAAAETGATAARIDDDDDPEDDDGSEHAEVQIEQVADDSGVVQHRQTHSTTEAGNSSGGASGDGSDSVSDPHGKVAKTLALRAGEMDTDGQETGDGGADGNSSALFTGTNDKSSSSAAVDFSLGQTTLKSGKANKLALRKALDPTRVSLAVCAKTHEPAIARITVELTVSRGVVEQARSRTQNKSLNKCIVDALSGRVLHGSDDSSLRYDGSFVVTQVYMRPAPRK